ncbi:hypothetical protein IX317_001592 [Fusobacterium sp. DD29]|uniref:autotransporter domain-containing protein n=1 Tax=unclassified Fusobacterium TaxID=2648384 RepID=UPI001B8A938F|nr:MULTISPECIES: autotransporter domain-containing protein [unclassified Fusobacterium]MBR8749912.1 hypothetical protein [Fusobacterium sp. DD29]MBR8762144.1 hypothetical protein [Fusobacterium sp. DD25]MBR8768161.1 hypothetical protein [Fusobacterium sp. DD43]MBR8772222.1 hypothetical protein [Fusobacterium sp. DD40]MBR8776456.1 hypothetical protein [Fusobacterium sp. DD17]
MTTLLNSKSSYIILALFITLSTNALSFDFFKREGEPYQIEEQIEQFNKPADHRWQFGYNIFFNKCHHGTYKDRYVNIRRIQDQGKIFHILPKVRNDYDVRLVGLSKVFRPESVKFGISNPEIPQSGFIPIGYSSGQISVQDSAYINKDGLSSKPALFGQQAMESKGAPGKMDIFIDSENNQVNVTTKNIKFTGVQGRNHQVVSVTEEDFDITGKRPKYVFGSTAGNTMTIDNIELNITGNKEKDLNTEMIDSSIFFITDYQNIVPGDATGIIGENTKINIGNNSSISFVTVADSNPNTYNSGFINNGEIEATGFKGVVFTEAFARYATTPGITFIQNNGKLKLSGERLMGIGEFAVKTSFENNGDFIIAGKDNTGLYYYLYNMDSELVLNSPITITGDNATGIRTLGNAGFAKKPSDRGSANQNAMKSTDQDISSTAKYQVGDNNEILRPAKIKIDITGNENTGFIAANMPKMNNIIPTYNMDIYLDDYEIKSKGGSNNMLMSYQEVQDVQLKKDTAGILEITGGEKNTALLSFYSDITHSGDIKINDSDLSVGVVVNGGNFTNKGDIDISGKGVVGIVASKNATVVNDGNLTLKGGSTSEEDSTGAAGMYVSKNSNFTNNGTIDIDVSGFKSSGLIATNDGVITLSGADIKARDGAQNIAVASGGKVILDGNNTFDTYEKSVFIYNDIENKGSILVNTPTTVNIHGDWDKNIHGTGLFFQGNNKEDFNTYFANYSHNYFNSTLDKLTFNLDDGRAFYAKDFSLKLSDTKVANITGMGGPNITGSRFKTFLLENSDLVIDEDADLDTDGNIFSKVELLNTSITNRAHVKGTKDDTLFMYGVKGEDPQDISLINDGIIEIGGSESIGIFLDSDGNDKIENNNMIKLTGGGDLPAAGIYSKNPVEQVENNKDIVTYGDLNYGIYSAGNAVNNGDIYLAHGLGNIGMFSIEHGKSVNMKNIVVGASDPTQNLYGIGMAAGYYDAENNCVAQEGIVVNEGKIEVLGDHGIGMYASGENSKAINRGTIEIKGIDGIGMFIDHGATGENYGTITASADAVGAAGILTMRDGTFLNYGDITITPAEGVGVVTVRGSKYDRMDGNVSSELTIDNAPDKDVEGIKIVGRGENDPLITINGNAVNPADISSDGHNVIVKPYGLPSKVEDMGNYPPHGEITRIAMQIDTSGINITHPIKGLENLPYLRNIDLFLGTEGATYTNSPVIKIDDKIIDSYNAALAKAPGLRTLNVKTRALLWTGTITMDEDNKKIKNIYLTKFPYSDFAENEDVYKFAEGLEEIYLNALYNSEEKELFNLLNLLKKRDDKVLGRAFYEMMGHNYANTYRRIADSRRTFEREFDSLMKWETKTTDTTKVKVFGDYMKYRTSKKGFSGYNRDSNGVFVLNNYESAIIGDSKGWFGGISQENFKFMDRGSSKERAITGQVGYHWARSYEYNRKNNTLLKLGIEGSYRKMHRKYVVADEFFDSKANYKSIGAFADMEYSKEYRTSKEVKIEPKVGVEFAVDRITGIKEKDGPINLDIKSRTLLTATPKAEISMTHTTYGKDNWKLLTDVDYKIFKTYGNNKQLKGRIAGTHTERYKFRKDKDKINSELSVGVTLEKPGYGVGAKVIRNLRHHYTGFQLDFRIKFDDID